MAEVLLTKRDRDLLARCARMTSKPDGVRRGTWQRLLDGELDYCHFGEWLYIHASLPSQAVLMLAAWATDPPSIPVHGVTRAEAWPWPIEDWYSRADLERVPSRQTTPCNTNGKTLKRHSNGRKPAGRRI